MARPVDPDVGLVSVHGPVLLVIAAGGALGALARLGLSTSWPAGGGVPWSTLTENVVGSALLGALIVVLTESRSVHRLVRPFLGTGVLGGFTTFSAYAVEVVTRDSGAVGAGYAVLTVVAALGASWVGIRVGIRVARR